MAGLSLEGPGGPTFVVHPLTQDHKPDRWAGSCWDTGRANLAARSRLDGNFAQIASFIGLWRPSDPPAGSLPFVLVLLPGSVMHCSNAQVR